MGKDLGARIFILVLAKICLEVCSLIVVRRHVIRVMGSTGNYALL